MTQPSPAPPADPPFKVIPPLRRDLADFGFDNFTQYKEWCAHNGLIDGLKKGRGSRSVFVEQRDRNRRPAPPLSNQRRQLLEQIATDRYAYSTWHTRAVERTLGDDAQARQALLRLLLHADRYIQVLRNKKVYRIGKHKYLLYGLLALAHHHRRWLRPVEDWHCDPCVNGHPSPLEQFSSLARHLLARYHVPYFMDIAFFEGLDEYGLKQQQWFLHVANGGNIRAVPGAIRLTRRMAHILLNAPSHIRDSIERSMRWAQVIGMGGDERLARTILSTRLGRSFDDDEFWSTVVFFLANNAMLDPARVGPLIDYIYNMKFAPRRIVRPEGGVEEAPPPQADFSMKGRSPVKLLRQVDAWHGHLSREDDVLFQSWQPCGLRPFELEDETPELGPVRWTVQELLSSWELAAEGRALHHCVVSYSDQCADGKTAIWSIALQRPDQTERQGALTVAIDVPSRTVTQARGRHNMLPNRKPRSATEQREGQSGYLPILNRSAYVLQRWMEREQLTRDD